MVLLFSIAFVCLGLFMVIHNVPTCPTREDRKYACKIIGAAGVTTLSNATECDSLEEELAVLQTVQRAVLRASPKNIGIPKGHSREPRDLFELGQGLCYDRSRVIEKILAVEGFKCRHAALFSIEDIDRRGFPLFARILPSHHVTEVMTRAGWMVLDSNSTWMGRGDGQSCIGLSKLKRIPPLERQAAGADPILGTDFVFVYGIYARHGYFYWPYNHIPDVNLIQFLRGLPVLAAQLWRFWTYKH